MKKDTQLLLALAAGLELDHKLVTTAANSPALQDQFLASAKLTKEDVFSTAESGVSFFNNKEVWPLMPKLITQLRAQGETITAEDFTRKVDGGNTLIEYAEKFGELRAVFAAENWRDNLDEMEKLWFSTTPRFRKTFDFWPHYHEAAKLSAVKLREGVFAASGIDISEATENLLSGRAHIVDQELKKHGEALSKDDLFLLDVNGKTVTDNPRLWDSFDKIVTILANNGETLSIEDMKRERAGNPSLLESAVQKVRVASLFTKSVWKGQMGDMLSLWQEVPEDKRAAVDMPALLTALEDYEFAHLIDLDNGMSVAQLTSPHRVAVHGGKDFDIRPLGLQQTWHNIWSLDDTQDNGLPPVGLDELRQPHGYYGLSCMHAAVRYGFAEVVVDMLQAKGEWFSADDLTDKRHEQPSILDLLVQQGKTDLVMDPANWVGSTQKRDDMIKIWQRLPKDTQDGYDIDGMLTTLNRLNLRARAAGRANVNQPRP